MSIELNQIDHREFQLGQINIKEYDINADRIIRLPLDRPKQEVVVDPSITEQIISPEKGKELSKVTVNPVTSQIDENIVSRNIRAGVSILGVDGDLEPDKPDQEKTVTPTKEKQEVVADTGYELAKTIVEPIPNEYIKPEGTLDIADNGNYDVKNYANVAVSVGGENKLAKVVSDQEVELTANDLDGATKIKLYAFYSNKNLKSIEIPYSATNIGDYAFQSCENLISVTIPNSVTSIGSNAFASCYKLSNINIPDSVTSIGSSAFSSCEKITNLIIGNGLTVIETYTFNYCRGLKSLSIGNSVTNIKSYAFNNCNQLTSVTIPNSVTSIGSNVFAGCSNLKNVVIGSGITSMSSAIFYNCTQLKKVVFEGQVPNLQVNVFAYCSFIELYDFRNCTTVPTLASTSTLGHKTGCKIVIPDSLYDEWTTASVWSTLTGVTWVKSSEYVE